MKPVLWRIWHVIRWPLAVLVVLYVAIVIYSFPHALEKEKTEKTIARIQAQKLTIENVNGEHLPPPPDPAQVDATIEGVDANGNGIRDDVELAIFEKYPNDAKVRAAELQYAMALQMYLTEVFNDDTLIAVAQQDERASGCIADQFSRDDIQSYFQQLRKLKDDVKEMVINSEARQKKANENTRLVRSFGSLEGEKCDVYPTQHTN